MSAANIENCREHDRCGLCLVPDDKETPNVFVV